MRSLFSVFSALLRRIIDSSMNVTKKGRNEIRFHAILGNLRARLIQVAFTAHRIASRDEKTYSFLNMFQLKSQSFVTLGSISPFTLFRLPLRYPSSCLLRSRRLLLAFAFRQERKGRKKERNRYTWIFLQQLLHRFSKKLKVLVYRFFLSFLRSPIICTLYVHQLAPTCMNQNLNEREFIRRLSDEFRDEGKKCYNRHNLSIQ